MEFFQFSCLEIWRNRRKVISPTALWFRETFLQTKMLSKSGNEMEPISLFSFNCRVLHLICHDFSSISDKTLTISIIRGEKRNKPKVDFLCNFLRLRVGTILSVFVGLSSFYFKSPSIVTELYFQVCLRGYQQFKCLVYRLRSSTRDIRFISYKCYLVTFNFFP